PMLGIDGNVSGIPDGIGEIATAEIVSQPDIVPETITFQSWHQDQGGASLDLKRIDISLDEGATWIPLSDCAGGAPLNAFPYCQLVDNRDPEAWDNIELDTSMWEGMVGQLRFSYDTVNACCGFERGWYIDELNFAQPCLSPNFANQLPCNLLSEDLCNGDFQCAWDDGASECFACHTLLLEPACDTHPLCEWEIGLELTHCIATPM
ncbi:MAG: hypothetical protein JKY37_16290, partial [Nannocystaceae bacterium]|nr:hypothetical protein [Nannocystaceae bacterium]